MHNEAGDLLRSSTEKAKSEFDAMVNEFTNLKLTKAKAMEEKVSIIKSQEENVSALLSSMFFCRETFGVWMIAKQETLLTVSEMTFKIFLPACLVG